VGQHQCFLELPPRQRPEHHLQLQLATTLALEAFGMAEYDVRTFLAISLSSASPFWFSCAAMANKMPDSIPNQVSPAKLLALDMLLTLILKI
jgi:succinylarginine dihydrolase